MNLGGVNFYHMLGGELDFLACVKPKGRAVVIYILVLVGNNIFTNPHPQTPVLMATPLSYASQLTLLKLIINMVIIWNVVIKCIFLPFSLVLIFPTVKVVNFFSSYTRNIHICSKYVYRTVLELVSITPSQSQDKLWHILEIQIIASKCR